MEQSSPAETTFSPFEEYLAPQTISPWSLNVWIHCRVPTFHTFTVLSELQLTAWLSGPKQTDKTQPEWPESVPTRFACFASYTKQILFGNPIFRIYFTFWTYRGFDEREHTKIAYVLLYGPKNMEFFLLCSPKETKKK